jgi:hypothetical protein
MKSSEIHVEHFKELYNNSDLSKIPNDWFVDIIYEDDNGKQIYLDLDKTEANGLLSILRIKFKKSEEQ